jgi:hypothetical protein
MRAWRSTMLALALLAGCPESGAPPAASAPCERIGDPCRLPAGPMGVCNESLAASCDTPPCLACISQH